MSKLCSSHNLRVLDDLLTELGTQVFAFSALMKLDPSDIGTHEAEWHRLLVDTSAMLEQSHSDLRVLDACIRKEIDMDSR